MKTTIIVFALSLLAFWSLNTNAQDYSFPPEKDKVSNLYYEGIRNYSNVSAPQLSLRSFLSKGKVPENPSDNPFNLAFDLDETGNTNDLHIFIEDNKDVSYYMIPIKTKWPSGRHQFTWSNQEAKKHQISMEDLYGRAYYEIDDVSHKIVPLTIFQSEVVAPDHYEFVFISNQDLNFRYTIFDKDENAVHRGVIANCRKNTDIKFNWYFEDAAYGKYLVQVQFETQGVYHIADSDTYEFSHQKP